MKVTEPNVTLGFGKYNGRALNKVEVAKLRKKLEIEGIAWYRTETMLPLLLPKREYIDESQLTKDLGLGSRMPILTLMAIGRKQMTIFEMASGQHRVAALKSILDAEMEDLEAMKKELEKLSTMKKDDDERDDAIEKLDDDIKRKEIAYEAMQWWGVIVYDESE
jgi:hypothetical protein